MSSFEERLAEARRTVARGGATSRRATPTPRATGRGSSFAEHLAAAGGDGDDGGGGGSILGNLTAIKGVMAAVPSGLAQLGAEAVDSTVGNIGAMVARRVPGVDAERVREEFGPIGRALINEDTLESLDDGAPLGDTLFAAMPLPVSLGKSFKATGGRVVDQAAALAPGGKPAGQGAYAEAFSRNQLLPVLIEDVGNAALLGSVTAKPFAAGARAAATRTGSPTVARVAAKAGDVADLSRGVDDAIGGAIFRPVKTITGKGIPERLAPVGRAVARTDRYQTWRESPLVRKALDETFISPRSRALGERIADDQQWAAFDSEVVLEALRQVTDIVGDQPELGIAAMLDVGQVNRLLPALATLDEATFSRLVSRDGALAGLADVFDEGAIRTGIAVANRYIHDPDSLTPEARAKLGAAADVWGSRVLPLMEERFLAQVGRRDEVHPETVQMLAGDELLPYEELRVIGEHVDAERRLTDQRDRLAAQVGRREQAMRVDEGIFADPIRVLRERAGDIESAIDDLFDTRGVAGVIDLLAGTQTRLDLDAFDVDAITPAQADRLRDELRRQVDARAGALSRGMDLPADPISDLVADLGLRQVIRPRARATRAAVRGQRAEGARRQAGVDAGRLDERVGRLEVKAADLAEILNDALTPKVHVGLGKLRASIRREGAANAKMRSAADALTRIKKKLRGAEVGDLAGDVRAFRADARVVIAEMLTEARTRAQTARSQRLAELSEQWERIAQRDTIGVDGEDGWAAVQAGLRRGGWFGDPRDVRIDGRRVFVDRHRSSQLSRAADDVAGEAHLHQNFADGTEDGFLEAFAAEVVAPAAQLQVNVVTKGKGVRRRGKRGHDAGDTSLYAEAPIDELLLSDLTAREILDEVLGDEALIATVFDDPEMVAALSGDEATAVDTLRAMRAERWEGEDFAEAVDTGVLLRSIDEEAADLAAGDPRSISPGDEIPAIGTAGRSAAGYAYDGDLGRAAEAGYDLEAGRRALERRSAERANAERATINAAAEKGARRAAAPATRAGEAKGRAAEAAREQRLAERRAGRANDAERATAEGLAEAQGVALERGRIEGRRMDALVSARRSLDRVEAEMKALDEGLAGRLAEARNKVTSAPAKYRIAIQFARDLEGAVDELLADGVDAIDAATLERLKAEIITTTTEALDVMDRPGMLFGGRVRGDAPKLRNVRSAAATKSNSEYLKEGVLGPITPADQALLAVRDIQRGAQTETAKWLVATYGRRADQLVPGLASGERMSGRQIAEAIDEAAGEPLVPLDVRRWMAEKGGNIPEDQITADTVFVPEWAVDAFTSATRKVGLAERLMRDYFDRPTRWWKHGVLAMSPIWHAGNIVGNVLMAWAGGVPPSRQLELFLEARAMINRARRGEWAVGDAPRRLYGTGPSGENLHMMGLLDETESGLLTRSEMRALDLGATDTRRGRARAAVQRRVGGDPLAEPTSRVGRAWRATRQGLARPLRTSYEFNAFFDDLSHAIVYLDRTTKGLDPDVALRDALRVAGDFSRLSRFERRFVRRALPFYSWLRHITTLSTDLAVNHPLRTAWTLNLWTMAVPDDADLYEDIPSLTGSIESGPGQFLRLANLFPFGAAVDVGEGLTDPIGLVGASANPIFKLGLEATTGLEFGPGGLQKLSRPYSSGLTDAYGNEKLGPIGWGPFLHRAQRLLPQLRGARELLRDRDDRVLRYDTGQPVTIDGRLLPDVNRQDAGEILARDILRLPVLPPIEDDPEATRARRADKLRNR